MVQFVVGSKTGRRHHGQERGSHPTWSNTLNPDDLLERISIDPNVCFGKPCIRGTRIGVALLLDLLAFGMTANEVLLEYPQLVREDLRAALAYGAEMTRERYLETEATVSELPRITTRPEQCAGRPCIRGLRVRVKDILDLLAAGASREEILADYPYLEPEDIPVALEYAARQSDHPVLRAS
jgi:uncharacterized protein (DUF433 family)